MVQKKRENNCIKLQNGLFNCLLCITLPSLCLRRNRNFLKAKTAFSLANENQSCSVCKFRLWAASPFFLFEFNLRLNSIKPVSSFGSLQAVIK